MRITKVFGELCELKTTLFLFVFLYRKERFEDPDLED